MFILLTVLVFYDGVFKHPDDLGNLTDLLGNVFGAAWLGIIGFYAISCGSKIVLYAISCGSKLVLFIGKFNNYLDRTYDEKSNNG